MITRYKLSSMPENGGWVYGVGAPFLKSSNSMRCFYWYHKPRCKGAKTPKKNAHILMISSKSQMIWPGLMDNIFPVFRDKDKQSWTFLNQAMWSQHTLEQWGWETFSLFRQNFAFVSLSFQFSIFICILFRWTIEGILLPIVGFFGLFGKHVN